MPTVSGGSSEEVSSQDEIKVFKYEGEEEESEKSSSESLLKEDKSSLITETEEKSFHIPSFSYAGGSKEGRLPDTSPFGLFGAAAWGPDRLGYLSPFAYAYSNGSTAMAAKEMGLGPGSPGSSLLSLYNGQSPLGQPPPAHMGISPYQLDPKSEYNISVAAGLRPHVYPFATAAQYPYSLGPDFTAQMANAWFSPGGLIHPHPGLTPPLGHHLLHSPKTELHISSHDSHRDSKSSLHSDKNMDSKNDKKPHIKKPLNAFMIYMKEMRATVVAECTLKESAAINQILGRKWHALTRDEQAKYYEMARKERQLHMQMYPGWSSRQNYSHGKKKKRNRDKNQDGANMKKCRARYGLEQQNQWCKPCRRKKKCVRYLEGEHGDSEDHSLQGSIGSRDMSDSEDDIDGPTELMDHGTSLHELMASSDLGTPTMPNMMMNPSMPRSVPSSLSINSSSCSSSLASSISSPSPSCSSILTPSPSCPNSGSMMSPASMSPLTPSEVSREIFMPPLIGALGSGGLAGVVGPNHLMPVRAPVGTNPRDINNPLSVNQLTGQCISSKDESRHTMVRVT